MTQRERLLAELQEALAETDIEESPDSNELVVRRAHRVVREVRLSRDLVQRALERAELATVVEWFEHELIAAPEQRERVKARTQAELWNESMLDTLLELAMLLDYEPSGEVTLDEYKRTILQRVEALRSLAYEPILGTSLPEPTLPTPAPYPLLPSPLEWKLQQLQSAIELGLGDQALITGYDPFEELRAGIEDSIRKSALLNRDTSGMGSDRKGESRKV